jgi:hypothetical protein
MSLSPTQTTFDVLADLGLPGDPYDLGPMHRISKIAAAAVGDFGLLVVRAAADDAEECRLPDATGSITSRCWGVAMRDHTRLPGTAYEAGDPVLIGRKGRFFVQTEEEMVPGDAVFARFTVESPDLVLGKFRTDADTDKAVAVPTAVVYKAVSATMCVIEINLP